MNLFQEMEVNYKDFIGSANDFMQSCKEFKFQENGYGKGFFEGQMRERKYWKDKIKAKIEELEKEQKGNQKDLHIAIDLLWDAEIDKISNKISVNLSIREILQSLLEKEVNSKCMK